MSSTRTGIISCHSKEELVFVAKQLDISVHGINDVLGSAKHTTYYPCQLHRFFSVSEKVVKEH